MNQIIFQKFICKEDLKKNRQVIYLFDENDQRKNGRGCGGLAKEIRGESNAIGIRVKKAPGRDPSYYYIDQEIKDNINKIDEDFEKVIKCLDDKKLVIIPSNGIGTGFARLKTMAPNTLIYVKKKIKFLEEKYNGNF